MKAIKHILRLLPILACSVAFAQEPKKDSVTTIRYAPPVEVIEKDSDTGKNEQVFMFVEQMPQFPGGMGKYQKFIVENVKYPKKARKKGIEGMVYISFIVDEEGKHYDEQVLRSPDALLSEEAIRVIKLMPAWKPGMQNGKPVKTKMTMPIKFVLDSGEKEGGAWIEKKK